MAPSIGLNLRVTGYKHQGGRKYMEDEFGVAYQQTADEKDLEYAFFGIFDGHGGREAALFAKEHLMDFIVRQKGFWADDDESVLKAIHEGFIQTHYAMWKELEKWPKTASGLPSTAGTTASIAFIRRGKIYIGHVGDSAIILGTQDPDNPDIWRAEPLTRDHKPESVEESERICQAGGKVVCKSGVPRVVWNRPKMGHKGPVRRSTHIDEIPFLAVARSLGDLWSYNSEENVFVVSPEPDIRVYPVDINVHRCLVLGTDGAWNMLTPQNAISTICLAEKANEQHMLAPVEGKTAWINPSKQLVDCAIDRWNNSKLRADNTSVVTVMLDPPGPPRAQVLKNTKRELAALNGGRTLPNPGDRGSVALVTNTTVEDPIRSEPLSSGPSTSSMHPRLHPSNEEPIRQERSQPICPQPAISIINRFPNATSSSPLPSSALERVEPPPCPPSLSTPPVAPKENEIVQCNEISSSEDCSPSPPRSKSPCSRIEHLPENSSCPEAPSQSPESTPRMSTRGSARKRSLSESSGTDGNSVQVSLGGKRKKGNNNTKINKNQLSDVEQRCQELNAKLEFMERKVISKTDKITTEPKSIKTKKETIKSTQHILRSSERKTRGFPGSLPKELRSMPSTPRGSRTPLVVRRKQNEGNPTTPNKTPKGVVVKKPVVTKSRRARILRLRK